jgi:2-polyprenyl-6-methoxyphenol hydroxylase-like FAD-dependent oxidoreductase
MVLAGNRDRKFICYPIAREPDGQVLTNWIAEERYAPGTAWAREDWNRRGQAADILPMFGDWHFPWLDVPGLIQGAPAIYEFPMVDRDPLPRWTQGRVTLLGDAAHPMHPIGSNGASQSILDARWLARQLVQQPTLDAGLAAYEAARRPATAAVVEANRGDGPDRVLDMVHARAPSGFTALDAVIPPEELAAVAAGYKHIAGLDPAALNGRESWSVPGGLRDIGTK